jgi:predicted nucleotidyltransferase
MTSKPSQPRFAPLVQAYLTDIIRVCEEKPAEFVSIVLFGSASTGGFQETVSDVDLILVLADGTAPETRTVLRDRVIALERLHGIRQPPGRKKALELIVDRITLSDCSFFICTRADLLSGLPGRLMNLNAAHAFFVDRIVVPGILSGAFTLWGEDLLPQVTLQPIRRLDVFKAFFGLISQAVTSASLFPLLPGATRYAMATLKHSVRSCYFCYHGRHAPLEDAIAFLQQRTGPSRELEQLLALRRDYRTSFAFVVRALPTLVHLHWRTAFDNRFPIAAKPC